MARKILLADDSVTAQNMGRKILADAGYDVVTVNNGSAALKRVAEIKPDLIVLDVYMPGYSGLEVCQRLKDADETAHIPILLTVGKLEPFKPEESRRVKADAHIVKPFEASELLTAITRLEDRMVPQQSEGGRFNTAAPGFSGDRSGKKTEEAETETGWKSRLRFPSKKKKEEPEPESEMAAAGASFRDFRKAKGKPIATGALPAIASVTPRPETGVVPDIPRDITPEELDALSALAEKLDGQIPVAENTSLHAENAPLVENPVAELSSAANEVRNSDENTVIEAPVQITEIPAEVETSAAEAEPTAVESTVFEPVVEPPIVDSQIVDSQIVDSPIVDSPIIESTPVEATLADMSMAPAEAPELTAEAPAPAVEAKNEVEIPVEHLELASEAVAIPVVEEMHQPEAQPSGTSAPEATAEVNTALLAQEPAPVDRDDEPMFALAASALAQALQDKSEESEPAPEPMSHAVLASAEPEVAAAAGLESKPEESKAENIEQPASIAAHLREATHTEEPPPSDEDLAEALRLLTPSSGQGNFSTFSSKGILVAAGQLLAEEAARNATAGPRWIAEPVMLSPDEAAISLEAEMFSTLAAATSGEIGSTELTGVSAIAAAVENRLAAAELAASANALIGQGTESSSEHGLSEHAPEASFDASTVEAPAELVAAKTFADAVGRDEVQTPEEQDEQAVGSTVSAMTTEQEQSEDDQDSNSDSGGWESMGKDVKSRSGKSNGRQVRAARAGAQSDVSDKAEPQSQAEHTVEESPKAMAAAAAAESSTSSPVPDASTIASIVDSVMADLRPRIVEEIARKLAGK